jgi:trypsin
MLTRAKLVGVVTAVALLLSAAPSSAITNGEPDGNNHPYVGFMEALDANGVPLQACSGSLVAPTVFLTAGHCVSHPAAARAAIWFDPGPIQVDIDYLLRLFLDPTFSGSCYESPLFDGYPCKGDAAGTAHPHPDFCFECGGGLPNRVNRDLAVIKLDEPVPTTTVSRLAQLPEPGQVDELSNGSAIDFAGYGVSFQYHFPGKYLPKPPPSARWAGAGTRLFASTEAVTGEFAHSDEFLRLSLNGSDADGGGGLCFGDSGGPDLVGGTDTTLAVNSYVMNYNCRGVGYSQRIDLPDVLSWIRSFGD